MENNDFINKEALEKQTIIEHLSAFRKLLIISIVSIFICFLIVLTGFSDMLIDYLIKPIEDRSIEVVYLGVAEAFGIKVKTSLVAGVILASPILLFQIWAFLKPALYKEEQFKFLIFYLSAVLLFATGVIFAYISVFHLAVNFFIITGETIATPMISIEKYIDFLFKFLIPFGIVFQLPIAILILTKSGFVAVEDLCKYRKYIVFTAFVCAAVLTPPDFISQLMLGLPMIVLYEVGILVSRLTNKK